MARVKPSAIIADIRGSVSGSVFARTSAGLVLKAGSKKADRNTDSQNKVRNLTSYMQTQWRQLSADDRTLWKRYATFTKVPQMNNRNYYLNGQQLYIKINVIRLLYGYSVFNDPQFTKSVTVGVDFTVSLIGAALLLSSSRVIDSSVEFVVCYATVPCTATLNNAGSRYKVIPFATVTSTNQSIASEYAAVFGRAPVSGETIFVKAFAANKETGLFTQPVTIKKTL